MSMPHWACFVSCCRFVPVCRCRPQSPEKEELEVSPWVEQQVRVSHPFPDAWNTHFLDPDTAVPSRFKLWIQCVLLHLYCLVGTD